MSFMSFKKKDTSYIFGKGIAIHHGDNLIERIIASKGGEVRIHSSNDKYQGILRNYNLDYNEVSYRWFVDISTQLNKLKDVSVPNKPYDYSKAMDECIVEKKLNKHINLTVREQRGKLPGDFDESGVSDHPFERHIRKKTKWSGLLSQIPVITLLGLSAVNPEFQEFFYGSPFSQQSVNALSFVTGALGVIETIALVWNYTNSDSEASGLIYWTSRIPYKRAFLNRIARNPSTYFKKLEVKLDNLERAARNPKKDTRMLDLEAKILYELDKHLLMQYEHMPGISIKVVANSKKQVEDMMTYLLGYSNYAPSLDASRITKKTTKIKPVNILNPWDVDFTDYKEALR